MALAEDIRQWRREQRATLLWRRAAVSRDQHRKWSDAITTLLVEGFPILRSGVVGCYWPYQGEFDPRFAMRRLRKYGVRVALPVVAQESAPLQFREWQPGVRLMMSNGALNVPAGDGTDALRPDILLIPTVGFDLRGYRLGYGGGNFDRTLGAMGPYPLKIGVAFELSRIPTIQPQPHDVPMNFIVTEAGIYYVSEAGLELVTDRSKVFELVSAIGGGRDRIAENGAQQVREKARSGVPTAPQPYRSPLCYVQDIDAAHRGA